MEYFSMRRGWFWVAYRVILLTIAAYPWTLPLLISPLMGTNDGLFWPSLLLRTLRRLWDQQQEDKIKTNNRNTKYMTWALKTWKRKKKANKFWLTFRFRSWIIFSTVVSVKRVGILFYWALPAQYLVDLMCSVNVWEMNKYIVSFEPPKILWGDKALLQTVLFVY